MSAGAGERIRRALGLVALLAAVGGCGSSESGSGAGGVATDPGYAERQQEYLAFAAAEQGQGGINTQLARLALGFPYSETPIREAIEKTREQKDTADFSLIQLMRLYYLFEEELPSDLRTEIEDTFLGFRYWFDQPGGGKVSLSENHQILFAAGEYLAGQRFPERLFPTTQLTGAEHVDLARVRILRWLGDRARFGYSEWLSATYYGIDVPGLLALIDFADDPEVRDAATVAMDLLAYDLAANSDRGYLGTTHGRVPGNGVLFDLRRATVATMHRILFDDGSFRGTNEWAGTSVATSRYEPPAVLASIARDRSTFVNRQRNGITVEEGPSYGYGFDRGDIVSGAFWYGMGAWPVEPVLPLTASLIEDYRLVPIEVEAGVIDDLIGVLGAIPDSLLRRVGRVLGPIARGSLYDRADIYTYRTAVGSLSSAQDDMKGDMGFQQHAWQATFGPEAVVFTGHPGPLGEGSSIGASYWLGGSSMPRVAQQENVLIALYDPAVSRLLGGSLAGAFPDFTHAYFPRARFDEVRETAGWVFGRKGEGYVALRSAAPTEWTTEGEYADRELVAPGARNVWICEIGGADDAGSFDDFVARISAARLQIDGLDVVYDSPSQGRLGFGWDGPLVRDGLPQVVGDHPRYSNPFSEVGWDAEEIEIRRGGQSLRLDLVELRRRSGS